MSPQASQQYPRLVPISYHRSIITDTPDIPVDLPGYERNVKKCKALIGIFIILSILSNAAIIATSVPSGASHALGLWEGLNWGFQVRIAPFQSLLLTDSSIPNSYLLSSFCCFLYCLASRKSSSETNRVTRLRESATKPFAIRQHA
jgi:hypothetical protein